MRTYLGLLGLIVAFHFHPSDAQIFLDESYDDWINVPDRIEDEGDVSVGLDILSMSISNDEDYLFILLELDREIQFQRNNNLGLYIDFDNNAKTGFSHNGLGAELRYFPGEREGFAKNGNAASIQVRHDDVGLVNAPTVSSNTFEIAVRRTFFVNGTAFEMGSQIRVSVENSAAQVEAVPDNIGGYLYTFNPDLTTPDDTQLSRSPGTAFRFMTYNVLSDGLTDFSRQLAFRRIFKSVSPDIIILQEVYDNNAEATASIIENFLPSGPDEQWYTIEDVFDNQIISRFPVIDRAPIGDNGAFVVDLGDAGPLLIIATHLFCCNEDLLRQGEVDEIIAFLRELNNGSGPFDLPVGTPIIVSGDMNFVGNSQQVQTLISGNIINESLFGPDFQPDWGTAPLIDPVPRTTALPFTYTWFSPNGSFGSGRLDYVLYTGSSLDLLSSFVLETQALDDDLLAASNLFRTDSHTASDHLPVVADFAFPTTSVDNINQQKLHIYPNPASNEIFLELPLSKRPTNLHLYDQFGREVLTERLPPGTTQIHQISIQSLAPGYYFITLNNGIHIIDSKVFIKI